MKANWLGIITYSLGAAFSAYLLVTGYAVGAKASLLRQQGVDGIAQVQELRKTLTIRGRLYQARYSVGGSNQAVWGDISSEEYVEANGTGALAVIYLPTRPTVSLARSRFVASPAERAFGYLIAVGLLVGCLWALFRELRKLFASSKSRGTGFLK